MCIGKRIYLPLVAGLLLLFAVSAGPSGAAGVAPSSPHVLLGNIYTNTVAGAAFVVPHKAAFLVRIGWMRDGQWVDSLAAFNKDVRHYHASSPGWKFNRAVWYVGKTRISFQWSRLGRVMVGGVKASGNIRIAIEATSSWKQFASRYTVRGSTISGEALPGGRDAGRCGRHPNRWRLPPRKPTPAC